MLTITKGDNETVSKLLWGVKRHLRVASRHVTARKLRNILICLLEMGFRRSILRSHPFHLRIEVSPYCNLHCPGCLLGGLDIEEGEPDHRKEGIMSYELFKDSVGDFLPFLLEASLYDEGEPLLNPGIYKMINYLSSRNVGTCVSSNFSLKFSDAHLEKMTKCGLDHLIVAVDGACQESYSRYRRGGRLDLVKSNIRRLIAINNEKGNGKLKVEMQFIDFGHNKIEKHDIHKLAHELGVWRLSIVEGLFDAQPEFKGTNEERRDRGCYEAWITANINSNGSLSICDFGEDNGLPPIGSAQNYISAGLRNHPLSVQLRSSFRDSTQPLHSVCSRCTRYLKPVRNPIKTNNTYRI